MTLAEIEAYPKSSLTPAIVAKYFDCDPAMIRYMARTEPEKLGFPVTCLKTRVKIPKEGFVNFCKGGKDEEI